MFTRYTRADAQVILEISPEKSREVLISNRDSLNHEFQNELDRFLADIAADTRSALSTRCQYYTKVFGGGAKTLHRKVKDTIDRIKRFVESVSDAQPAESFVSNLDAIRGANRTALSVQSAGVIEQEEAARYNNTIHNLIIVNESMDPKIRRQATLFEPTNWAEGGGRRYKILRLWSIAVEAALQEWMEIMDTNSINYGIGFIFSNEVSAANKCGANGSHNLLLNPVDNDGKIRFSVTDRDSWIELITLACHEVAHCSYIYHDEDFASLMTNLVSKVFTKLPEIVRQMKLV